MTGPAKLDVDEEPWSLATHFHGQMSNALGAILRDVIVVGSATLGDWQPHSDIDRFCVVTRTLTSPEIDELARLHECSRHKFGHTIDAVYVTPECLSLGPDSVDSAVESVAGAVHAESTVGQLNWVTWLNILQSGVRIGPKPDIERVQPADSGISIPEAEVREQAVGFSAGNLDGYWRNRITFSERMHMTPDADHPVPQFEIQWMSLGPARLLATVLTGCVVSKSDGGRFAVAQFPGFEQHIERVLDTRTANDGDYPVRNMSSGRRFRTLDHPRPARSPNMASQQSRRSDIARGRTSDPEGRVPTRCRT